MPPDANVLRRSAAVALRIKVSEDLMTTITEHEERQVKRANTRDASRSCSFTALAAPEQLGSLGRRFKKAGSDAHARMAGRPGDRRGANADPEVFAHKTVEQVADHFADLIGQFDSKPAMIGHSFGGLITQIIAGRGLAAASVAIDPAPFRGVLPLPISALKSASPCSANRPTGTGPSRSPTSSSASRSPTPSPKMKRRRYTRHSPCRHRVSRCSRPQAPTSILDRGQGGHQDPDRGPLLIIDGQKDNTVPWAIANASFKRQRRNEGVTEIVKIPNRGHSLTIDGGWREVADIALKFVQRFVALTTRRWSRMPLRDTRARRRAASRLRPSAVL